MDRDRTGSERADVAVSPRLLGGVAVVQDEQPLGEEEADEPGAHEHPHPLRVVEDLDRLRQHVEQRDRDDDAAAVSAIAVVRSAAQAERSETPAEGREHGDEREGDRDPGHLSATGRAMPPGFGGL